MPTPTASRPDGPTYNVRRRTTPFTPIPNQTLLDTRLSLKAKGLLAIMLSRPDGWIFTQRWLIRQSATGRDATRAALTELENCGYITRYQPHDQSGRFTSTHYEVTDLSPTATSATPTAAGKPGHGANALQDTVAGKTGDGETGDAGAGDGKPDTTKTDRSKTEKTKTERSSSAEAPEAPTTPLPSADPTPPAPQNQPTTAHERLTRLFGPRLLAQLTSDLPTRATAWAELTPDQIEHARRAATTKAATHHEERSFRTLLKLELDNLAPPTPPAPPTSTTTQLDYPSLSADLYEAFLEQRTQHEQRLWQHLPPTTRAQLEPALHEHLTPFHRRRYDRTGWTPDLQHHARTATLNALDALHYPSHLTDLPRYANSHHAPEWFRNLNQNARDRITSGLTTPTP